jgi:hypothetical protein
MATQRVAAADRTRQKASHAIALGASGPAGESRRRGIEPALRPSRLLPVGGEAGSEAPPIVHEVLRGPGAALEAGTRSVMPTSPSRRIL